MKQVSTAGDDMPPAPVIIPESSGGEGGQVRVDLPQAFEAGEDEFFDVTLDMLPPRESTVKGLRVRSMQEVQGPFQSSGSKVGYRVDVRL